MAAWRRQCRRHLPSALVDRCLALQIEIRLNCHILGRDTLSDFHFARPMPELAALFPATAQDGFQIVDGRWYSLLRNTRWSGAKEALS
jgi:hypothetical protein